MEDLAAERVRSGQQNGSQLEPNYAPAVAPRSRLEVHSAEPQHAALPLEEELPLQQKYPELLDWEKEMLTILQQNQ